jgi:hypothetical protein
MLYLSMISSKLHVFHITLFSPEESRAVYEVEDVALGRNAFKVFSCNWDAFGV